MKKKTGISIIHISLIIAAAIVPLIVYMRVIPLEGIVKESWTGGSSHADFFHYWKSNFILIAAVVGLAAIFVKSRRNELVIKKQYGFILLSMYALLIIISTVSSEYLNVSLYGFVDRYEGAFVLLSYILFAMIGILFIKDRKDINTILIPLTISAVIIGVIGIFQYYGYDYFQSDLGKRMILPPKYQSMAESLKFNFGEGIMYGTLYNPNFVGSYTAMLLPLSIGLYFNIKGMSRRILFGVFVCGIIFSSWIGSMSRAGMLGGAVACILLLILLFRKALKEWQWSLGLILYFIIIFSAMNFTSDSRVANEFNNINPVTEQKRIEEQEEKVYIEDIVLDKDMAYIKTNKIAVKAILKDNQLSFQDDDGNYLRYNYDKDTGKIEFIDEKYQDFLVQLKENKVFDFNISGIDLPLAFTNKGFQVISSAGKLIDIEKPRSIGFVRKEKFASNRGYIWSRTIPMLKQTVLLGKGPDSYAVYFPQNDVVGKLNAFGKVNMVVDKPHDWYLQMAFNTGIISASIVLLLLAIYFIKSFIKYIKQKEYNDNTIVGIGILCAVTGYSIAALFNDSVVSVAPVFWVLLGIGISLSNMGINENVR